MQSVPIITNVVCSNPNQTRCTRYNIMWWNVFSPGTPIYSTNKANRHDIAEILLKVSLNTKTFTIKQQEHVFDYINMIFFQGLVNAICLFRIISFPSKHFLFLSARPREFEWMLGTRLPVSMYTTKTSINKWRFNVTQLKEFFLHFLYKTEIN